MVMRIFGFFLVACCFLYAIFHFSKQIQPKSRHPITNLGGSLTYQFPGETIWHPYSINAFLRTNDHQKLLRMKIQLPIFKPGQNSIYIKMINIAGKFYFNDQIIYEHGDWDIRSDRNVFANFFEHLFLVPAEASGKIIEAEIYSDWKTIGIYEGILLGNDADLREIYFRNQLPNYLFAFFYLIVGIFALLIYWLALDKSLLYFGSIAISIAVISLAEANSNLTPYLYHEFSPFMGVSGYFGMVFSFGQFIRVMFPKTFPKTIAFYLIVVAIDYLYSLFIIINFGFTRVYCEMFELQGGIIAGVGCIITFAIATKEALNKDKNARILLLGFFLLFSTFPHYLAFQFGISESNANDIHFRFFPLMMSLVWIIAIRYQSNLNSLKETTALLQQSKLNLEEKVKEKTISLEIANDQLSKEIKTKSDFFANISHEFKTPLTLIISPSEKLAKKETDEESLFLLSVIHRNSKRIQELVEDLLTMARIDFGVQNKEEVDVELFRYFKKSAQEFKLLCDEKNIEFRYDDINSQCYAKILKHQWDLIIRNVLSNAVKFTNFGFVELKISISQNEILISVKDTGIGIQKSELDLIFNRFYQSERNKESSAVGTGIGLYLVKEMVRDCGGSIEINSMIDKGTEVSIKLPFRVSDRKETEINEGEALSFQQYHIPSKENSKKELSHILIVEDEPSMAEYLEYLLKDQFRLTLFHSIESALASFGSNEYDLVLSDWTLPGRNGSALLQEVRLKNKNIPFLFLTARTEEDIVNKAFQLGADDFIQKPFRANDLISRILQKIEKSYDHNQNVLSEIDRVYGDIHDILGGKLTDLMLQIEQINSKRTFSDSSFDNLKSTAHSLSKELRNRLQEWEDFRNMKEDFELGWMSMLVRRYTNVGRSCRIKLVEPSRWEDTNRWSLLLKTEIFKMTQELVNNDLKYGEGVALYEIKSIYPSFEMKVSTKSNYVDSQSKGRGTRNLKESCDRMKANLNYSRNSDQFLIHFYVPNTESVSK